jgi:hypothetical protein
MAAAPTSVARAVSRSPVRIAGAGCGSRRICNSVLPWSVYKGQFGHIDNHDPIELLGRERGKRMVWEATDAKKARMTETARS